MTPRLVTVALSLGALLLGTGTPVHAADSPPPAPAPAVLRPAQASGPPPTATGVQQQIGRLARGGRYGLYDGSVLVLDPATSTVLYDLASSQPRIPASTAKLATSVAALTVLGPTTRIPTVVAREGDTVYLVGGGDPTLVSDNGGNPLRGGRPSLARLTREVSAAVGRGASVQLVYDASAFRGPLLGPGWPRTFPAAGVAAPVSALIVDDGRARPGGLARVPDPAKQAGRAFARLLARRGITVTSVEPGIRPQSAQEIARVESEPIEGIVHTMLTDSENNYAEALAHLVGGAALQEPTFAGGARATLQAVAAVGIDTTGMNIVDGSGLSGRNRIPVRVLADILADVVRGDHPPLAPIAPGLAVAGMTGTLADRFGSARARAGRGFVHAKTGTLTGVSGLAGTVLDADGRTLVFAILSNGVRSQLAVHDTMDVIASRLAKCGCS